MSRLLSFFTLLALLFTWQYTNADIVLASATKGSVTERSSLGASGQVATSATSSNYNVGDTFQDCDYCPEMVVIPSGSFDMGSNRKGDVDDDDEKPVHRVTIPEEFSVGKFEVTKEEFTIFVNKTGYDTGNKCLLLDVNGKWKEKSGYNWNNPGFSQSGRAPVTCLSWDDTQAYLNWLSRETGQNYRLLSESEWEYAGRAYTTSKYFTYGSADYGDSKGKSISHNDANYGTDECCNGYASGRDSWVNTSPVGSFSANRFGLYDFFGNVSEWVEDCISRNYNNTPANGHAYTWNDCEKRVLRGGSWASIPRYLRSADRGWSYQGSRSSKVGFRVARSL